MTDLLPTVDIAPDPAPEPAAESRTWPWKATLGTAAAILAIAGAGVALGHQTPPTATVAPVDQYGHTACTPDVAEAYPDARDGVAVIVHAPGPAVVSVSVSGGVDRGGSLSQQVTKRAAGAQFDFPQATPVSYINVMINRNLDVTTCYVPIPDTLGY
jgi:hypothetical protein